MPIWSDFFKLFTYASEKDALARRRDKKELSGAGVSQADALQIGGEFAGGGGPSGMVNLRQTYDMIDTTSLNNRTMRYKEYERLRNVPEIEMALTVMADEACLAGDTPVATPFGYFTLEWLAKNKKDERFLVYCYDFQKKDYSLGWAFNPRLVKKAKTVEIIFDNGQKLTATPDHRILKRNGTWTTCGELSFGDELMPFYRLPANQALTKLKTGQYPRIYTHNKGWIHERQFVEDWKSGKTSEEFEKANKVVRMVAADLSVRQIAKTLGHDWKTADSWMRKQGFSLKEVKSLAQNRDSRRVVGIIEGPEIDVYDLSVEKHMCFATDSAIVHNCQKNEDGDIFKIECKNEEVVKELNFTMKHRKMLNLNEHSWKWFKNLLINGDWFLEYVINPDKPSDGILKLIPLPPETMYRIETIRGKLVEYQQSKEGPDYKAITSGPVIDQTESELNQSVAIRFAATQICHMRIGDDRKTFYPYGQSLIEPARSPAHQLRLMEDAMVVYRLTRAPERRVFYIDVGQLPPFKAEAFLDRLKDQFRKRKVANNKGVPGANQVEERWQPPAADEDYWIPIRPNANTRIETLPGAQNLGEIDDAIYFRNKLFTALNFPKNYLSNEDTNATRITLSAQDVKFARMIERLQGHFENGLMEIAERHLQLRGFPEESYEDLKIKMTPPSDWRELSRNEVITARYANAGTLKSGQLMSDYDIYRLILKFSEDEIEEMLARLKLQKLEDLKLQIVAQNPAILGVGIPGQEQPGQELGAEAGGPAPQLSPDMGGMPPAGGPPMGAPPPAADAPDTPPMDGNPPPAPEGQQPPQGQELEDPSEDDIKKFDLEIQDYSSEQDHEDRDRSVGD
jgi:hypothetical protein